MEIARDAQSIEPIHIYCDNQGLLRATGDPGAQTAQLQMTRMHQAIAEMPNPVHLHWIPGHTGILEHDHSDTLAKRATGYRPGPKGTTQGRPTNPPDEDISTGACHNIVRKHTKTQWIIVLCDWNGNRLFSWRATAHRSRTHYALSAL
jgi:hypothetical protein